MQQQDDLNPILRAIQAAETPAQILEVAIDHVVQTSGFGLQTAAALKIRAAFSIVRAPAHIAGR